MLNVLWTPVNLMVRVATAGGFSPGAIALIRWGTLGALILSLLQTARFRQWSEAKWPTFRDGLAAVAIGALFFGPAHAMYYLALIRGASTVGGTVLNATSPIWTALLAFALLKERATVRRTLSILLGFAGAYVVVVGFGRPQFGGALIGSLIYLAGTISEALATVLAARLVRKWSGITILNLQVFGAVGTLALLPLLLGSAWPMHVGPVASPGGLAIAFLILVPGLVCFGVWYSLVKHAPLSVMVVTVLLQPPLSALLAWWFVGEVPTLALGVGSLLIAGALIVAASEPEAETETA